MKTLMISVVVFLFTIEIFWLFGFSRSYYLFYKSAPYLDFAIIGMVGFLVVVKEFLHITLKNRLFLNLIVIVILGFGITYAGKQIFIDVGLSIKND